VRKIKWIQDGEDGLIRCRVGSVIMRCIPYHTVRGCRLRWFANISIREISGTFRFGPIRKSKDGAKRDAIRIAKEMLDDYRTCLEAEMANFADKEF